jgi:galactokinase
MANTKIDETDSFRPFVSIAPGRLCLFGEHQDYLHLPVISLALPLVCQIHVQPLKDSRLLKLQFGNHIQSIDLDNVPPKQVVKKDEVLNFMLAAVHEVLDDGWTFDHGADCVSTSTIPLQAGCSSSSAFCVAWIQVLARLANRTLTPLVLAQWAHRAEVVHFDSPGGTMDHITSAVGGILRIGPRMWDYQPLDPRPSCEVWILADSGQPKETLKHLNRCKGARLHLLDKLGGSWDNTSDNMSDDEEILLQATRTNRDMEEQAASQWKTASGQTMGGMMTRHFEALRDGLLLSTNRLNIMNETSLNAGAWGFKLVGSGGGGCGVAYCSSDKAGAVVQALKEAGATDTWLIRSGGPGAIILDIEVGRQNYT